MTSWFNVPVRAKHRLSMLVSAVTVLAVGLTTVVLPASPAGATAPAACGSPALTVNPNDAPPGPYTLQARLLRGMPGQNAPYVVNLLGVWTWFTYMFTLRSPEGAGCQVDLEYLDLPAGVTSQMPSTVTLSETGIGRVDLNLDVAANAALGDSAFTVRARIGSQTGTAEIPLAVVDEPDLQHASSVVEGANNGTPIGIHIVAGSTDRVVRLSSSDPGLVPVPSEVTFPAGASFRVVTAQVGCLPRRSPEVVTTITVSLGDTSRSFDLTITPATMYSHSQCN